MNPLRYHYMNIAELLDTVFYIYKKTFVYQLLRVFIIGTVSAIVGIIAAVFLSLVIMNLAFNSYVYSYGDYGLSWETSLIIIGVVLLFLLIIALVASVNNCCGISLCSQAYYGKKPNFNLTVNQTLKNTPRVFFVNILVYFLYAVVVCAAFGLLYVTGIFDTYNDTYNDTYIAVAIIIAVVIAWAIVGFIYVIFCCAVSCAFFEKLRFHKALKKSISLIKGCQWKIFAASVLWILVNMAIRYNITVILALPSAIAAMFNTNYSGYMAVLSVLSYGATILTTLVMAPFADIFTTLLYHNQKIKKEGMDIILELEA